MVPVGGRIGAHTPLHHTLFPHVPWYGVTGLDSGRLMLLDTATWASQHQVALPSPLVGLAFAWPGSELAVFPDTLAPAVKLTLCVCTQRELPVVVQV